jgi:hypothetical protein
MSSLLPKRINRVACFRVVLPHEAAPAQQLLCGLSGLGRIAATLGDLCCMFELQPRQAHVRDHDPKGDAPGDQPEPDQSKR